MQTKIMIGTPSTGGIVKTGFTTSLANLVADLGRRQIDSKYVNINASALPEQRDYITHVFLKDKEFTHLLFIDSDMWFPPDLAFQLLSFGKPIVGTVYARRQFDFPQVKKKLAAGIPFDDAFAQSFAFIISAAAKTYPDEGDLISVGGFGMGFVLIRRDCLERIAGNCKLRKYENGSEQVTGFFQPAKGLSEDLSFCHRWHVECGHPLFAYSKADILHIGDFSYGVPYARSWRRRSSAALPGKP